jgi:hypothetical protein
MRVCECDSEASTISSFSRVRPLPSRAPFGSSTSHVAPPSSPSFVSSDLYARNSRAPRATRARNRAPTHSSARRSRAVRSHQLQCTADRPVGHGITLRDGVTLRASCATLRIGTHKRRLAGSGRLLGSPPPSPCRVAATASSSRGDNRATILNRQNRTPLQDFHQGGWRATWKMLLISRKQTQDFAERYPCAE